MAISATVIGRGSERAQIAGFLDDALGRSAALLLEGEAGIGKTTLWDWGVDEASERGCRVLKTRAVASEATLSFVALGDLLEPVVDDVIGKLPQPQRHALDAALLRSRSAGAIPDRRAVALATLGSIRAVAHAAPVLLAIDDVQWLDAPSASALRFALRRLRDEPVGVLAALRMGERDGDLLEVDQAYPGNRVQHLSVRSMTPENLRRLVRDRLGADLPRPVIERVHRVAGGNPFFALEIARELARLGVPAAGEALPLPDDLRDLMRARLGTLSDETRAVLLAAAATPRPTETTVLAAVEHAPGVNDPLAPAIEAGVVSVDGGQIRFMHPLLAATIYGSASPDERRYIHRRLAARVADPEERARHLALAAQVPDIEVASALEDAASLAGTRGAPESAAELAQLARRLTPASDVDGALRRTAQAASYLFDAGDDAGSRELMEEAIAAARSGDERARLLFRMASVSWMDMRRVQDLCERALAQSGDDRGLHAAAHDHLAWVGIYRGDVAVASRHSHLSMDCATQVADPAVRADAYATFGMVEFLLGRPAEPSMDEAERLYALAVMQDPGTQASMFTAPPTCHGLQLLWAGELAAARDVLERELRAYENRGRYIVRDEVLGYLAELECRAGNWDLAEQHAREGFEIDVEAARFSGEGHQLFPRALVAAHRGDVGGARADAEVGLQLCIENGDRLDASCHRAVLGFLELSMSQPTAALRHLEPALQYLDALGSAEPGIIPCVPDAVEALVALGRPDEAEELVQRLDEQGRLLDRRWARATALRCRGLLLASRGALLDAIDVLEVALEEHELVPQPFDRARTLLVKGEVERRAKKKKAARSSIEEALGVFDRLGAPLWSTRARGELGRIGGRPPSPAQLTETERQVAELVAEGKTNAEVAGQMFMSVHTVRSNLRRIYAKVGIQRRSELAFKLRRADDAQSPHADQ